VSGESILQCLKYGKTMYRPGLLRLEPHWGLIALPKNLTLVLGPSGLVTRSSGPRFTPRSWSPEYAPEYDASWSVCDGWLRRFSTSDAFSSIRLLLLVHVARAFLLCLHYMYVRHCVAQLLVDWLIRLWNCSWTVCYTFVAVSLYSVHRRRYSNKCRGWLKR